MTGTAPQNRSRILIVDDHPLNIETLRALLKRDYDVSSAASGPEALAVLADGIKPDLILLDVMMPAMDGYQVCAEIKRSPEFRDVPIIFVTAKTDAESETRALSVGAVDFVTKPISASVVRARIKLHLDLIEQRHALEVLNRQLSLSLSRIRLSESRLKVLSTAIEQSPAAVMITNAAAAIEYVNPRFTIDSGYTAAEVLGKDPHLLASGLTRPDTFEQMWTSLREGSPWSGELLNRRKSGELYWEEAHMAPVRDADGKTTHFISVTLDITARKRLEQDLRASEEKFRTFVESANDIIYTIDLNGRLQYISPNWGELMGYKDGTTPGEDYARHIHPDDLPVLRAFFDSITLTRSKKSGVEYRVRHATGDWRWHTSNASPLFNASGELVGTLGIARDINERRETEERIRHMAHFDALTDLPNRTLFEDRLQQALQLARRAHNKLALMYIDLDRFKPINDTHGHATGDLVLQEVARRMSAMVRSSDTIARIGGDEFVALLPFIEDADAALRVAEKMRAEVEQPITVGELVLGLSCSIGIALYPEHGTSLIELSRHADIAMYEAKKAGRNAVRVYDRDRVVPGEGGAVSGANASALR